MLVNPELGGVTLGWTALNTAQDELFAAIEGTAFHTRVIFDRMAEYGVPIRRVINGGGIPQKNEVLNRVYANVLNKPVLVPKTEVTSLGSAIFAFLAAGTFQTIEEAQRKLCPKFRVVRTRARHAAAVYDELYRAWRKLYFGLGRRRRSRFRPATCLPLCGGVAKEAHNRDQCCFKHCVRKFSRPTSSCLAAGWRSTRSATPAGSTALAGW